MNTLNESTKSLNTMTEVQEEQIQGGLKSALQEEAYGVVASGCYRVRQWQSFTLDNHFLKVD